MTRNAISLVAATWLIVLTAAGHGQDEPANLKSDVERLVRQLDADLGARREEAERALLELGPVALEHFPPITPRTPAEVKERLGRVRMILEKELAADAAQPALVTLRGEMSLAEAFAALEEQSGNRIAGYEQRGGQVQLDLDNVPFWQALDHLLDEGELQINIYGGEPNALVVEARPSQGVPRSSQADYEGVFRFQPVSLEARRDLRNPSVNGLRLTIEATWEPRLRPITLQLPLDQVVATDETGRTLRTDAPRTLSPLIDTGISGVEFTIPLELPSRDSDRIASLKGTLNAVVPGTQAVFEFEDLTASRDVEQQRAGVAVIFERLRRNEDLYEVRVRVRFDEAGDALQSHQGWVYNNKAVVRDSQGETVENVAMLTTRQADTEVGLAYLFSLPDGPDGCTFIYSTPSTILRLPVEFKLPDIRLP